MLTLIASCIWSVAVNATAILLLMLRFLLVLPEKDDEGRQVFIVRPGDYLARAARPPPYLAGCVFYPCYFSLCLTVSLETNYLTMFWTDIHQLFRFGTYLRRYYQSDTHSAIDNQFFGNGRKLAYLTFIHLHRHSTTDWRIATLMDALTLILTLLRRIEILWVLV